MRTAILPDVDLLANRWLFRHLTAKLDQRVLAAILSDIQSNLRTPISLSMNLKSVMSEGFTQMVRILSQAQQEKIIIEIQCVDLMADPGALLFVQSYLGNIGFRLALDGVVMFSFPEFARRDFGFHNLKMRWNEALENDFPTEEIRRLEKAISQIGADKVILRHCGTPFSMEFGHKLGVHNFQGRFIDELLNPAARRQN